MPRVAQPAAACRKLDPLTGKVLGEFNLGVIGSCTRLTVTPNQFFYRPGGGEGRTVYFDFAAQKLADYEGVVRPGCFDGVVPANGRLYWMPLACDCWQVHGTFSMAPRVPLQDKVVPAASAPAWAAPTSSAPAAQDDWPMFRANGAGTATVPVSIPTQGEGAVATAFAGQRRDRAHLCSRTCVGGWCGRYRARPVRRRWPGVVAGIVRCCATVPAGVLEWASCLRLMRWFALLRGRGRRARRWDGIELAPATRFVNIMNRFMSAWPLGGGVILSDDGIAYTAAGSTAADGAEVAAVDVTTGKCRWRQIYTLDRADPKLSFGVQGNILLKNNTLFINGGAPVGIVALDAVTGGNPRAVARLEAGMEMFLDPDDQPLCTGPELYANEWARTTIFKRHQGRVYFPMAAGSSRLSTAACSVRVIPSRSIALWT